jgi:hypothetical protein
VLPSCNLSQSESIKSGRSHAENELQVALSDTTLHNIMNLDSFIIRKANVAISVAEPILFSMYGKENIINQRPYESYQIDKYWIISGTLPKGSAGGTFLIILDARNSKVIRLTHGK